MKNILLYSLFFLISYKSIAQNTNYINYHKHSCSARDFARNGAFDKAVQEFKRALNSVEEPKPLELYFLGKCYAKLGKKEEMIKYLEIAYKKGYWYSLEDDSLSYLPYWSDIDFLILVDLQESYKKHFYKTCDSVLTAKITQLFILDEKIRIQIDSLQRLIYPSSNMNTLYQKQIDSLWKEDGQNLNRFMNIIKEYGYPSHQRVGNGFAEILLIHCEAIFHENKELLYSELQNGNLMPWEYAAIYDRANGPENCKYGGYFCNSYVPIEELLKNRESIGLNKSDCIPVDQISNKED